ncbi:MAG TPA: succinate dehydrogenase/fumarate reductase iron-sulfur subunit [Elusimicrobia bacterium]|nr:MAG: fumarate reductase [Elusimicrobia bacterium GWA2_66_18]OGR74372.1 MAG: fumarate reductase [Elusimicrobia bacterium GWC2_65_9]HAZ06935.1 succinate dehydrogenase/fumarate reductase iron-sulfur subunit [Elusimicrobiota bacterium]
MNLTLKVWRQKDAKSPGGLVEYQVSGVSNDMSFLEMLDILNEELVVKGEDAICFDHDCREGICGMCALMIDGQAHGKDKAATSCQLHMRRYQDGDTITIEPFRAKAFPVVKDLVVDRSAFDRIQAAGGFVSVGTGGAVDANCLPVPKQNAEKALDAASCIGCGACVAACPNASAMLFVAAKVSQYALLPQGRPEREKRALAMRSAMDAEGFGHCSNEYECEAACPKDIKVSNIARLNREFLRASVLAE